MVPAELRTQIRSHVKLRFLLVEEVAEYVADELQRALKDDVGLKVQAGALEKAVGDF